uniref:Transmembrane domain-containing protein n=1 Tax=Spironucleus salmonicida TaxID=348837 RepID=V6LTU8_9EUKA|eukprot:EST48025.1 Transmembrane domain-containing protein [Spironucleus salmonicida]
MLKLLLHINTFHHYFQQRILIFYKDILFIYLLHMHFLNFCEVSLFKIRSHKSDPIHQTSYRTFQIPQTKTQLNHQYQSLKLAQYQYLKMIIHPLNFFIQQIFVLSAIISLNVCIQTSFSQFQFNKIMCIIFYCKRYIILLQKGMNQYFRQLYLADMQRFRLRELQKTNFYRIQLKTILSFRYVVNSFMVSYTRYQFFNSTQRYLHQINHNIYLFINFNF